MDGTILGNEPHHKKVPRRGGIGRRDVSRVAGRGPRPDRRKRRRQVHADEGPSQGPTRRALTKATKLQGKPLDLRSPHDAANQGIGVVPQEISVIPELTVAENVVVGRWTGGRNQLINMRLIVRRVTEFLAAENIHLNARQMVLEADSGAKAGGDDRPGALHESECAHPGRADLIPVPQRNRQPVPYPAGPPRRPGGRPASLSRTSSARSTS